MNPLVELINNSGYDIYFLVVDKHLDINLPELKYFYKIYLPVNEIKNSGHLLSLPSVQKFIRENSQKNSHLPAILPFKSSAKINWITNNNGWLNLSNPPALTRFLENKIKFYQFCQQEKLPVIPSQIDKFNRENFNHYFQGKTGVIQTSFGWAGNSSFLVKNFREVENKIPQGAIVKYSPYLRGKTYINNCCLTRFGLLQSPPARQLTGLKAYTPNPLTTVGRVWPSGLSFNQITKLTELTNQFGQSLAKFHYRGYFGLDFQISQGQIFILECNPRLTASFAFYHLLEKKKHLNSLLYFHLLEWLDLDYHFDFKHEQARWLVPIHGRELTPRDQNNQIIKKINEI